MKFILKNISNENPVNLMRKAGYFFFKKEGGQLSFLRLINRTNFPRFHVFLQINKETNEIIVTVHLDQKRPTYKGVPAHAGEYEDGVIVKEAERIKSILSK